MTNLTNSQILEQLDLYEEEEEELALSDGKIYYSILHISNPFLKVEWPRGFIWLIHLA
jgi:hypothetical protein